MTVDLAGTGRAEAYVDRALRRGALLMHPGSPLFKAAQQFLALVAVTGARFCPHIAERGEFDLAFIPLTGPDAFHVICVDCYVEPPATHPCSVCGAARTRLVVCHPIGDIVWVHRLCAGCRAGRVTTSSLARVPPGSSTSGELDVTEPGGPSRLPGSNIHLTARPDRGPRHDPANP